MPQRKSKTANKRVLAAIVFTDVVDFSKLVSEDEERALGLFREDSNQMHAICVSNGGRVLKMTGDGLLMYFQSAADAVTCAVKIQQTLSLVAQSAQHEERLQHRIGVHLGDVIMTKEDVMGDGVNIASRLQEEADPGGICISQTVYDVVKNKVPIHTKYIGKPKLKNIDESVPTYKILNEPAAGGETLAPEREKIAILRNVKPLWLQIAGGVAALIIIVMIIDIMGGDDSPPKPQTPSTPTAQKTPTPEATTPTETNKTTSPEPTTSQTENAENIAAANKEPEPAKITKNESPEPVEETSDKPVQVAEQNETASEDPVTASTATEKNTATPVNNTQKASKTDNTEKASTETAAVPPPPPPAVKTPPPPPPVVKTPPPPPPPIVTTPPPPPIVVKASPPPPPPVVTTSVVTTPPPVRITPPPPVVTQPPNTFQGNNTRSIPPRETTLNPYSNPPPSIGERLGITKSKDYEKQLNASAELRLMRSWIYSSMASYSPRNPLQFKWAADGSWLDSKVWVVRSNRRNKDPKFKITNSQSSEELDLVKIDPYNLGNLIYTLLDEKAKAGAKPSQKILTGIVEFSRMFNHPNLELGVNNIITRLNNQR